MHREYVPIVQAMLAILINVIYVAVPLRLTNLSECYSCDCFLAYSTIKLCEAITPCTDNKKFDLNKQTQNKFYIKLLARVG